MQTINISNFRKDLYNVVNNVIKFEPIRINTKNGNAIVVSEEEYLAWKETIYLCSIKGMRESIIEGSQIAFDECIQEKDFKW